MSVLEKLMEIQGKLKAPKSQYNKFGGYNYRNCEDILEALKPLLCETKSVVTISDEVIMQGQRYYIKSTAVFIDVETGERIENAAFAREEEAKKGMDGAQVTGSSSSYARKYALNGLFGIDDTKDSDTTNTGNEDDKKGNSINKHHGSSSPTDSFLKAGGYMTEARVNELYTLAEKAGYTAAKVNGMVDKRFKKKIYELNEKEFTQAYSGFAAVLDGDVNVKSAG